MSEYDEAVSILSNTDSTIDYLNDNPDLLANLDLEDDPDIIGYNNIDDALSEFYYQVPWDDKNTEIDIYRVVFLSDKDELDIDHLGKYWTDKDNVFGFASNNYGSDDIATRGYVIHAKTKVSNIDLLYSFYLRLQAPEEHEIRVLDDAKNKVKLINLQPAKETFKVS